MEWYRWFPTLYLDDTMHLNLEQDAIYRRIIDWYMINRLPLPCHGIALARICQISLDKWKEHEEIITKFFTKKGDKYHLKRCDIELNRQDSTSRKLGEAAKKAHEARKINNINQEHICHGNATPSIEVEVEVEVEYKYRGKIIKLNSEHFSAWERSYKNINLLAELQRRDDWLANNPDKQKNWFLSTSNWFAKLDSEAASKKKKPSKHMVV